MTDTFAALRKACKQEVAAEKNAAGAEKARREAWWVTTWALADLPLRQGDPRRVEGRAIYIVLTGHSANTFAKRFKTGRAFTEASLTSGLNSLPKGKLAQIAAENGGTIDDLMEAANYVRLGPDGEPTGKLGRSVREFQQHLTGKSWTNAPENLTDQDKQAIVKAMPADAIKTAIKSKPEKERVAAQTSIVTDAVEEPAVAAALADTPGAVDIAKSALNNPATAEIVMGDPKTRDNAREAAVKATIKPNPTGWEKEKPTLPDAESNGTRRSLSEMETIDALIGAARGFEIHVSRETRDGNLDVVITDPDPDVIDVTNRDFYIDVAFGVLDSIMGAVMQLGLSDDDLDARLAATRAEGRARANLALTVIPDDLSDLS